MIRKPRLKFNGFEKRQPFDGPLQAEMTVACKGDKKMQRSYSKVPPQARERLSG